MRILFCFCLLSVGSLSFAQTLRLKVESYDIKSSFYNDRFLTGHMDAQGNLQGTFRFYYLSARDTFVRFEGTMRDDVLVDTAYWYSHTNVVRRKAVFGGRGLAKIHVFDKEYGTGLPGVQHGSDLQWENNGNRDSYMISAESYDNGQYDGPQLYYFPDGKVRIQEEYRQGKKHGTYTENFASGALHIVGNYMDGFRKGPWNTFDEAGNQQTSWYDGTKEYPDSTIVYAADRKTINERILYTETNAGDHYLYEGGRLVRFYQFRHTSIHGKEVVYYANGNKQTEAGYEWNNQLGAFKSWYENGKPKQEYVQAWDGREGAYTSWYENGRLKAKGQYVKGEKTGTWEHYSPTGKKLAKPTPEMDEEENVELVLSIQDAVEGWFEEPSFIDVQVLPAVIPVYGKPLLERDLSNERDLKFLRRYKTIRVAVSVNGWKTSYEVLSPMKEEQAKLLEDYLAREFEWKQLLRFGRKIDCTVNLELGIVRSPK